jgi:hypothetical protein
VSRRATMEMQTQQFALATGSVGPHVGSALLAGAAAQAYTQGSRRITAECSWASPAGRPSVLVAAPGAAGACAGGGSRRASGAMVVPAGQAAGAAGGSRRVTTEQMVQQQLAGAPALGMRVLHFGRLVSEWAVEQISCLHNGLPACHCTPATALLPLHSCKPRTSQSALQWCCCCCYSCQQN